MCVRVCVCMCVCVLTYPQGVGKSQLHDVEAVAMFLEERCDGVLDGPLAGHLHYLGHPVGQVDLKDVLLVGFLKLLQSLEKDVCVCVCGVVGFDSERDVGFESERESNIFWRRRTPFQDQRLSVFIISLPQPCHDVLTL